jgi:hypothetical protein
MPGLGVFHAERSVESRELREKPLVSTRRRETPFLSDSLLDLSKADSPLFHQYLPWNRQWESRNRALCR